MSSGAGNIVTSGNSSSKGVYSPEVADEILSVEALPGFPIGSTAGEIKAAKLTFSQIQDDETFPTIPYVYDLPSAGINVANQTVEVGEIFNVAVVASFDKDDAGDANRVVIEIDGAGIQDTEAPALDYTYDDVNVSLGDGETRTYRSTIHYDEGPVRKNNKGDDQPGNVQAGSVSSAIRTKTPSRKIYGQMNTAKPANSAQVRALSQFQWDNDLTMNIAINNGDTSLTFICPDYRKLKTAKNVSSLGLTDDQTVAILATEELILVEGASAGFARNFRLYHFAPAAAYTAGTYQLTFENI